jgi:hypothetical protein
MFKDEMYYIGNGEKRGEEAMSTNEKSAAENSTAEKALQRTETLQKYVSDMMAVEEHIGSAAKRQAKDKSVANHEPEVSRIINNIEQATERHELMLKQHLNYLGGDAAKGIKEVATAALGTLAGIYDKMRTEPVSKMLRDDYTALNLASIGYTMLHTTGLALNDQATADLALHHLREYTALVMEINQVIPGVVVAELRADGGVINDSIVPNALANTQAAWLPSSNANGNSNAGSAAPKANTTTSKRTTVSRKRSENDSASADANDILVASETASGGGSTSSGKSSSNGSPASASTTTTTSRKRSSAATKSTDASKKSTSTKKDPTAAKRSRS